MVLTCPGLYERWQGPGYGHRLPGTDLVHTETGQPLKQLELGGDWVEVVAAGPGKLLASGGRTATVWLWDAGEEAAARELAMHLAAC